MFFGYWYADVFYLVIGCVYASVLARLVLKQERAENNGVLKHGKKEIIAGLALPWLITAIFFPVVVCYRLWGTYKRRRDQVRARQREEEIQKRTAESLRRHEERRLRVAEWKNTHLPTLCFNTIAGVTAVMRQDVYEAGVEQTRKARINGFWGSETLLMPVQETFLFVHKMAVARVPDYYRAGWLSDFEDLKLVAVLARREDIFVPFVSSGILPTAKQVEGMKVFVDDDQRRLEIAREKLLRQDIPAEITA